VRLPELSSKARTFAGKCRRKHEVGITSVVESTNIFGDLSSKARIVNVYSSAFLSHIDHDPSQGANGQTGSGCDHINECPAVKPGTLSLDVHAGKREAEQVMFLT
jgi:hypothetical protein